MGVFAQIGNIETSFGVKPVINCDDERIHFENTLPGETSDDLSQFKDDLINYINEWKP